MDKLKDSIQNFIDVYGGVTVIVKSKFQEYQINAMNLQNCRIVNHSDFGILETLGNGYPVIGAFKSNDILTEDQKAIAKDQNYKVFNKYTPRRNND